MSVIINLSGTYIVDYTQAANFGAKRNSNFSLLLPQPKSIRNLVSSCNDRVPSKQKLSLNSKWSGTHLEFTPRLFCEK